ncbi:HopJ type III effector protein [Empedobacter sp. 189-2]|uniref:HopJ type III effector protein n=1 Tax=Empedobacter sp. 189-2 TaxID=2746724 RepID=UPI00257907EA|nr:HopJ type III effector protein [Empedobacter sp. 189-2]MDM1544084.1 HopJ type III effector protein [Empedobacter sp. 189-2]
MSCTYLLNLDNLSKEDTLKLFAEHYEAVLATPEGTDHNNIRQFIKNGWEGLKFKNEVLTKK